jgi:NTP pyrophosphatase (non-canonical NTP hydrolase)
MNNLQIEAQKWLEEKYKDMDFRTYQRVAESTAIYPEQHKILYPALGLAGEAGEVANKVKKLIRDGFENAPKDWREQIASEIGDVLWYCAALASDLNINLSQIASDNERKLTRRKQEGKLSGSGDDR